jgi:hypothetical protein
MTVVNNQIKSRSKFNLSIDIIMLLLMLPVAGIGFLIKYVLLPGNERNLKYGSNIDLEFWGLDRHEWGTIHMIISICLLVLLALHIILHWKLIVCIFQKMVPNKSARIILASLLTITGLLMISSPLFIKPELIQREPLHQNRSIVNETAPLHQAVSLQEAQPVDSTHHHHALNEEYEVYGSQTLQNIADTYNIPLQTLAASFDIPVSLAGERMGRLGRRYGFTMTDVRSAIKRIKTVNSSSK